MGKLFCPECDRLLIESQFYSKRDKTKYHICKFCSTMLVDVSNPETFLPILKELDYPFIIDEWKKVIEKIISEEGEKGVSGQNVLGKYLSKLKLPQYSSYGYEQSDELNQKRDKAKSSAWRKNGLSEEEIARKLAAEHILPKIEIPAEEELPQIQEEIPTPILKRKEEEIDLAEEDISYLSKKWGDYFSAKDYIYLENLYQNMVKAYEITTPSHIDYLENICKISLKMRQTLDINDIDGYNKLARTYDNLMKSAKFTAAQDKSKDHDFINSIGEFVLLLEKTKGEIPRYNLDVNLDTIDKILMDYKRYVTLLIKDATNLTDLVDNAVQAYEKSLEEGDDVNEEELFGDESFNMIEDFDGEEEDY